jgi:hypothetical protein
MRHVGARDEARLVADYERCGQRCCCKQFLRYLKPISMRMAKVQKATLDPAKISGRCGRLMCCLRYEDATYTDLNKALPRRKTWVRTNDGVVGRVVDTQILTQLVKLMLPDRTNVVVSVEEIAERNVPEPSGPPPAEKAAERGRPPRPRPVKKEKVKAAVEELDEKLDATLAEAAPAEQPAEQDKEQGGQGRKKRRKRRRKKSAQSGGSGGGPRAKGGGEKGKSGARRKPKSQKGSGGAQQGGQGSGGSSKKKRRRKPSSEGGQGGQGGGESGGGSQG